MDVGERYLELVLRFRRVAPSLVESYVGPGELAARTEAEARPTLGGLVQEAALLREAVQRDVPDHARAAWLDGQLRGVQGACEWLAGAAVSYRRLVQRCHGVEVAEVDESQFEHAHELIARALPGPGTPGERFTAWRASQLVCGERVVAGLRALAKDFRRRSHERWELPDEEAVEFELIRGRQWAANADYRGGLRTVVQINDELPIAAWRMVELVAHEAYPGHHAEAVCKDSALVRGRGWTELGVFVYPTPQALIGEGIAMLAPEVLLGDEIEQVGAVCLRPLGIDYDTAGSAAVRQARELLLPVRANLAVMLDAGRVDPDAMWSYARRWLLDDDAYVRRVVDGLRDRHWPPYESCYPEGLRLCRDYVGSDPQRFGRLLREQLTPADLTS